MVSLTSGHYKPCHQWWQERKLLLIPFPGSSLPSLLSRAWLWMRQLQFQVGKYSTDSCHTRVVNLQFMVHFTEPYVVAMYVLTPIWIILHRTQKHSGSMQTNKQKTQKQNKTPKPKKRKNNTDPLISSHHSLTPCASGVIHEASFTF